MFLSILADSLGMKVGSNFWNGSSLSLSGLSCYPLSAGQFDINQPLQPGGSYTAQ